MGENEWKQILREHGQEHIIEAYDALDEADVDIASGEHAHNVLPRRVYLPAQHCRQRAAGAVAQLPVKPADGKRTEQIRRRADGRNKRGLCVGKAVLGQDVRLRRRKDVEGQPARHEQHQRAARAG